MKAIVGHIDNIQDHPNANKLDIIQFVSKDFTIHLVTGKHYMPGERGLYIPVGEEVPDRIAEEMWLLKKLGGPKKNIVETKNMRGIESSGLYYGEVGEEWDDSWQEGQEIEL